MYRERFVNLVNAAGNDEDIQWMIESNMNNLAEYVNAVYGMEIQLQTLRFRLEGAELREAITTLDRRRRNAHEAAIAACSALNRVAGILGTTPIYDGDVSDRNQVADFCIAVVEEIFKDRTKCSLEELLKG